MQLWIKSRIEIVNPFTVSTFSCIASKLRPLTYHQSWHIKDCSIKKITEINHQIDSKLKPWKKVKNNATIKVLEHLEKKIKEYSSSIHEISKCANNMFQESEDSFEAMIKGLKKDVCKY